MIKLISGFEQDFKQNKYYLRMEPVFCKFLTNRLINHPLNHGYLKSIVKIHSLFTFR